MHARPHRSRRHGLFCLLTCPVKAYTSLSCLAFGVSQARFGTVAARTWTAERHGLWRWTPVVGHFSAFILGSTSTVWVVYGVGWPLGPAMTERMAHGTVGGWFSGSRETAPLRGAGYRRSWHEPRHTQSPFLWHSWLDHFRGLSYNAPRRASSFASSLLSPLSSPLSLFPSLSTDRAISLPPRNCFFHYSRSTFRHLC